MLLRFRFANHRSIREEQELSLVGTEFNEGTARPTGVHMKGRELAVLPALGIFGANASGKSNVVDALWCAAAYAFGQSRRVQFPFKLDSEFAARPSLYEMELVLGDTPVRYVYGFEVTSTRVLREWLHAYPQGKRQTWFDRDSSRGPDEEFVFRGAGLAGRREIIAEMTRPDSLFLTIAALANHDQLEPIHTWCESVVGGAVATKTFRLNVTHALNEIESLSASQWRVVRTLLAMADLGITDISFQPERYPLPTVSLMHGSIELDLERDESMGTLALFAAAVRIAKNLATGQLTLFDEIGASMHPALAAEIVRLFQDPRTNPNGAQLLFTSHDATMLAPTDDGRLLDRDQIWFTEKGSDGTTSLYPLTEAKPRREDNIERRYLRGHYGAVPHMSAGRLMRAVAHAMEENAA